jgi:phosphoglycerate dehydrogenase-like enzyme
VTAEAWRPRVLVTDTIMARFGNELTAPPTSAEWIFAPGLGDAELVALMPEVDVLVCSTMSIPMALAADRLRLVHVTGAGYDKIPVDDLGAGVAVANTFHHAIPIAEHVIMASLMLSRRVLPVDREMRSGVWRTVGNDPTVPFHPVLRGRTIGLIGFGGIAQEVARLAAPLGMRVRAIRSNPTGPVPSDIALDWVGATDELGVLLAASDVVVVTVPLSESTRGLVDAAALARMRPGAILVNVARGPIVDEQALYDALTSGGLGGAAIDVWWGAPGADAAAPPAVARFAGLDNVVLTPHHSGHARTTFEQRAADISANVERLAHGLPLQNVVRAAR